MSGSFRFLNNLANNSNISNLNINININKNKNKNDPKKFQTKGFYLNDIPRKLEMVETEKRPLIVA